MYSVVQFGILKRWKLKIKVLIDGYGKNHIFVGSGVKWVSKRKCRKKVIDISNSD
eukprot:UN02893